MNILSFLRINPPDEDYGGFKLHNTKGSIAIADRTMHTTVERVVEAHPDLVCEYTAVRHEGRKKPGLLVQARINPGRNAELSQLGQSLQHEIANTLEAFAGCAVNSVDITFTGTAEVVSPAFTKQAARADLSIPSLHRA